MDDNVSRLVGAADGFELLSRTFEFPDASFADALKSGSWQADAFGCLESMGKGPSIETRTAASRLSDLVMGIPNVLDALRREYSLLYLAPGCEKPVFPYESAFLYRREGRSGVPALFRSPTAMAVENQMRQAGVLPVDARTEPVDSFWNEAAFLAFMLGKSAQGAFEGSSVEEKGTREQALCFTRDHAERWFDDFLSDTISQSENLSGKALYAAIADACRELCRCALDIAARR